MAINILPTIEDWSASKDKFRVVAYGFTRPFPLAWGNTGTTSLVKFHEINDRPKLFNTILTRNGIPLTRIHMRQMRETDIHPGFFPENLSHDNTCLRTLLIDTKSEDTSNWKVAAEEISSIYADGGFGKDQIEVEIRNPCRMARYTSSILDDDDDILAACQSVKSELLDQIRTHCGSAWSSVAFHNRSHVSYKPGPIERYSLGPEEPTVLVYCNKGSRCDFDALESALLKIIRKVNAGLRLELLPGSVISANSPASTPIPRLKLFKQPLNGSSIGPKGDMERSGTLGGWFMLNLPGRLPSKVVLTSQNLFSGIGIDLVGARNKEESEIERLEVGHPAPCDTMATIKRLEDLCLKPDCPLSILQELKGELKDFRDATTAPPIGHMIATSGYRLNENCHRMDWALIQVSSCITENKPPSAATLRRKCWNGLEHGEDDKIFVYKGNVTPDSIITNLGEITPGSWAAKHGKTTGATSGYINRMPRIIQWDDQQESEEVDFVGWVRNFAQAGDSGSFVVDELGNLVGLLIATDPVTSCAFVTPIGEVLADVKAMTGGNLTIV